MVNVELRKKLGFHRIRVMVKNMFKVYSYSRTTNVLYDKEIGYFEGLVI